MHTDDANGPYEDYEATILATKSEKRKGYSPMGFLDSKIVEA